jgi:hypothetical protein
MVRDAAALTALREEWAGVVKMRERIKLLCISTFAFGAFTAPAIGDMLYNLPLLLAFDVLGEALKQIKREGHFSGKSSYVGPLMDSAKTALPWLDWTELREGVRRRNGVAHDGSFIPERSAGETSMPSSTTEGVGRAGLAIALVALAALHLLLGLLPTVRRQRTAHVIGLFEPTLRAAADVPLVGSGIDQFALCRALALRRLSRCGLLGHSVLHSRSCNSDAFG